MRKIKFRAWDWENKVMLNFKFGLEGLSLENREVCDVMQFTGLTDKNGKEIYEGDIVKMKTGGDYTELREVIFEEGAFRFNDQKTPHAGFIYSNKETEVIGNIYQNPELLNEK